MELKEMFKEQAENAAKRLCGQGQCFAKYDCGHCNRVDYGLPKCGNDTTCPLEKYNVNPQEQLSFVESLKAGIGPLTEDDLFAICACCKYGNPVEDGEYVTLERSDETYEKHCLDCPVNMAYECMMENMAEAMMS